MGFWGVMIGIMDRKDDLKDMFSYNKKTKNTRLIIEVNVGSDLF